MARTDFSIALEDVRDIPVDKTPPTVNLPGYGAGTPAVNSGVPEIKCVINRKSPFVKTQFMNDALIFNAQTIRNYPQSIQDNISANPGSEGVFLRIQYVNRHTFLAAPTSNSTSAGIELDKLSIPRAVFSSGLPIYERYQRFLIYKTVFDDEYLTPSNYVTFARENSTNCRTLPIWQYELLNSGDIKSPDTLSTSILMPKQVSGTTCNGYGVHWRVIKQTPTMRGQDFFVTFHKRAAAPDVAKTINDTNNPFLNSPFKISQYAALDVLNTAGREIRSQCGDSMFLRDNRGVVTYTDDGREMLDNTTYDIRDQAYYIIEIGQADPDHNYFIIITQRGAPICVRLGNGSTTRLGEFNGVNVEENTSGFGSSITGQQLISADWCRVTVRNHLGDLHVTFEGPNFKSTPWIIHRIDTIIDDSGSNPRSFSQTKMMVVPRARITIWGGNMNAGFIFGILHYFPGASPDATAPVLTIPPRSVEEGIFDACQTSTTDGPGLRAVYSNEERSRYLSLPANAEHKLLLTATDEFLPPLGGTGRRRFFTQDAQIMMWVERSVGNKGAIRANRRAEGLFFYDNLHYKEKQSDELASSISVHSLPLQDDPSGRMSLFQMQVELKPGSHIFDDANGGFDDGNDGDIWRVDNCVTPVLTMIRLVGDPGNTTRWESQSVDVSEHVMEYTDCWSAQDFFKIEHTGTIKFLLNPGAFYENDQSQYILSLAKKAFYIEIWVRYRDPFSETGGDASNGCNYSKIPGYYKLFTGVCYGGTVMAEMGQRLMECQIFDYTKVLQESRIFNSPFYDGVRDTNAVYELLKFAGFRDRNNDDPGVLLSRFAQYQDQTMRFGVGPDGRLVPVQTFALPDAYSKISQPFFKFSDGTTLYDAIFTLSQKAGKCFFFDSHGVAHHESYFDFSVLNSINGLILQDVLWRYTTNPNLSQGQMVYNAIRAQRTVGDVFNHVKILTSTPDGTPIWVDDVDWTSVENPTQEGFVGYLKSVYLKDGILGSYESAKASVDFYAAMRRPPLVINFESFGLPIRALDLITFDGQLARVMKVDTTINAKENKWWNTIEAEWLFAINTRIETGTNP